MLEHDNIQNAGEHVLWQLSDFTPEDSGFCRQSFMWRNARS